MDKVIKVNPLRVSSIQEAIKKLETYKKILKEFPMKYTEAMMETFKELLLEEAPSSALGKCYNRKLRQNRNMARSIESKFNRIK